MINGIINVYKEKGFTSHDVVAKLRGILRQKKIGHTGTLDPDAEGVLPVCLGKGTKLCDMLTDKDKIYEATLLLGITTDTQDTSGKILQESAVSVSEDQVREAIMGFVGDYDQIPPMYSALKVNGKKLYELAREGVEIERQPRRLHIYDITIEEISLPRVRMSVSCSKGTYIRTLCHDIGHKLGTGGCMEKLLRTKVGRFLIVDSLKLNEIEELRDQDGLEGCIIPIDEMFTDYPAVTVSEEFNKLLYNGNAFLEEHILKREGTEGADRTIRVYDEEASFIGVYKFDEEKSQYRPVKMFFGSN
ncbi:tRNA pseudouridine(55) synthase TruB [Anaerobium acetethylicum]|uniref:tRNA pseudouridine synthase B n=1 Tax=Anaerobium acetethylicum TaxID=1619234 RepID=A0A1D3TNJ2_9FIRM|nr:tRNA pseudouridine(55) synthase TruB [Anaerobium acetethylicum]SCP94883.1 tRNA pseudouridine55 synthase [Anaerobium acetethylicum]